MGISRWDAWKKIGQEGGMWEQFEVMAYGRGGKRRAMRLVPPGKPAAHGGYGGPGPLAQRILDILVAGVIFSILVLALVIVCTVIAVLVTVVVLMLKTVASV